MGFDLATGDGKISAQFPGKANICNDMTVASDGTVYVTNSLTPQILQLKPGRKALEVWLEDRPFQPPRGAGLDGIAIGGDGNIYVNTFNGGGFFRVEVKAVCQAPSRSLKRRARSNCGRPTAAQRK